MFPVVHSIPPAHIPGRLKSYPGAALASSAKTDRKAELRDGQRRWLDQVLEHTKSTHGPKGLSLTGVARAAGIDDTTLTKFRNKADHKGTLLALTIRQISDATGYPATAEALGEEAGSVPAIPREREAEPYVASLADPIASAVQALCVMSAGIEPWVIRSRALEYEGFRPGDVLVVDLNGKPEPGDVVCVQIYDWQLGGAEIVFRLFQPPILVGAGPEDSAKQALFVTDRNLTVLGVMVASFRRRTGRAAAA